MKGLINNPCNRNQSVLWNLFHGYEKAVSFIGGFRSAGGKDAGSGSKRSASTEDEDVEDPLRLTIQPIDGQRAATQDEPVRGRTGTRGNSARSNRPKVPIH